jgi:hypothetical protein
MWMWMLSCAYVTRDEYLRAWDADGDGWPLGRDCAPHDPDIFPGAPDRRGDGCDTDCGLEPDADGDDWPDKADCRPQDPHGFPCSPWEVDGDKVDLDCDGLDGIRTTACPTDDPDYPPGTPVAACDGTTNPIGTDSGTGNPPGTSETGDPGAVSGVWAGSCDIQGTFDAVLTLHDQADGISGSMAVDAQLPNGSVDAPYQISGTRDEDDVKLVMKGPKVLPWVGTELDLLHDRNHLDGTAGFDPPVQCSFRRISGG